jgi:predicted ATPase
MINEILIDNIRIFSGQDWKFPLSPMTVFCGTNSAGKTTILKTILLLRQCLGIKESPLTRAVSPKFVGDEVDLGDFYEFISHNEVFDDIGISMAVNGSMSNESFKNLIASKENIDENILKDVNDNAINYFFRTQFQFGYLPLQISRFQRSLRLPKVLNPEMRKIRLRSVTRSVPASLKEAKFDLVVNNISILSWNVKISIDPNTNKAKYFLYLPADYFERIGGKDMMVPEPSDDSNYVKLICTMKGLLPESIKARTKETDVQSAEVWRNWPLPQRINICMNNFIETLNGINYLGPLRAPGKRYYVAPLGISVDIDSAGEFLPYVLRDRRKEVVKNILPGANQNIRLDRLIFAVNAWIYYLRTGQVIEIEGMRDEMEVSTTKGILVEFKVKTPSGVETHPLADSGFGYSQVLPIIVRGLLAPKGSTIIIEQPELHLNPALQVRLTEFFIAMLRLGKQIILETHSEHIVNSIRVFAAEDESNFISDHSSILYLDIDRGQPVLNELSIKPDGTVPNWPISFFGEAISLSGRLLRAQKHNDK